MLSLEDNAHRTSHKRYFLQAIEVRDYNVMADGQNFFDKPVKNDLKSINNFYTFFVFIFNTNINYT